MNKSFTERYAILSHHTEPKLQYMILIQQLFAANPAHSHNGYET